MTIPFLKMHGLGNDFVIFDARKKKLKFTTKQIQHIADRRFGVGCDQVILMEPKGFMRIYNPDGSESDACGNATRCVAWLMMKETGKKEARITTNAGTLVCSTAGKESVKVNMGPAKTGWKEIPLAKATNTLAVDLGAAKLGKATCVNMGNPHAIFFVKDADAVDLATLGPKLEKHTLFPKRANISVAQIIGNKIKLRVWERGAGLTLACGTAACAAFIAANLRGLVKNSAKIQLPGGELLIEQDAKKNIWMTGPVATSFTGTITL